ncbi:MAG: glycosyltransferase [Anaeromyxobacter sp.]
MDARRQDRRPLGATARFAVFGTNHWEQNGLWPALRTVGAEVFFDYLAAPAARAGDGGKALGRSFLRVLDDAERSGGPISLVFFYAAGFWLDDAMLAELRARGIWTVLLALDDKQQLFAPPREGVREWQARAARGVDLYWTTWRSAIDWLAAEGATPWYAPAGADPRLFRPVPARRDLDVVWVGRGYGPRYDLVRSLRRRGFAVQAYGPGWEGGPVPFEEMMALYGRAAVVLGMGGVGQTDAFKHLKGRDFEVPMSGALYLTSFNPELTDHFRVGEEILCYSSVAECADVLRWVLARPDLAERIRAAARARSLRDHTWDARMRTMLDLLGSERAGRPGAGLGGTRP